MTEVREVSISESAEEAAKTAAHTFTHEPNPHPIGTPEYLEWHRIYCTALLRYSAEKAVSA